MVMRYLNWSFGGLLFRQPQAVVPPTNVRELDGSPMLTGRNMALEARLALEHRMGN
jgi:hypothetical protein